MTEALVYAKHNSARTSVKKLKPVMDLVRGKGIEEAKVILAFDRTKAAKMILKVLKSAEANARNNMNIDPNKTYISDIHADEGQTLKRGRFVGRGRFSPILKRTSHIVVGLSPMEGEKLS